MSGSTTTKMIAQEAGINEAVLYRHFSSKEEIFYAWSSSRCICRLTHSSGGQPPAVRMTRAERLTFMSTVMSDMVDQLAENLPALGLVLFGSPGIATLLPVGLGASAARAGRRLAGRFLPMSG